MSQNAVIVSTTALMTNGTIPPRPQIKLKFNPPAKSTVAQENQDPIATLVPSEPAQAPTTGPSNNQTPIPTQPRQMHPFPISTSNELWPTQRKSGRPRARPQPSHRRKPKTANTLAQPTNAITI